MPEQSAAGRGGADCRLRLVERCGYPNCVRGACPALSSSTYYPTAGQDTRQTKSPLSPLDYFGYLGLVSYADVSRRLRLAERTVRRMSYSALMTLALSKS